MRTVFSGHAIYYVLLATVIGGVVGQHLKAHELRKKWEKLNQECGENWKRMDHVSVSWTKCHQCKGRDSIVVWDPEYNAGSGGTRCLSLPEFDLWEGQVYDPEDGGADHPYLGDDADYHTRTYD
mmetsp:Transcript_108317/g.170819  ORF Transcript_108317/g.170819 Transcript_108317/m.170819 type:complete len:124 (-) Transcript_108317:95-466(-)